MSEAVQNKEYLDQSDLSDKEDAETLDLSPFKVDWYVCSLFFFLYVLTSRKPQKSKSDYSNFS